MLTSTWNLLNLNSANNLLTVFKFLNQLPGYMQQMHIHVAMHKGAIDAYMSNIPDDPDLRIDNQSDPQNNKSLL